MAARQISSLHNDAASSTGQSSPASARPLGFGLGAQSAPTSVKPKKRKSARFERTVKGQRAAFERIAAAERREKMKRCGIPPRFEGKTSQTSKRTPAKNDWYLSFPLNTQDRFDGNQGKCAVFIGTPGTGKTHLAVAIGLDLLNRGKSVLFCTAIRAIRRIKDTWEKVRRKPSRKRSSLW